MKMGVFKQMVAVAVVTFASAIALAYIPEGVWTDGYDYYYVNNRRMYCTSTYNPNAGQLSYSQVRELRTYSYQGQCENYDKGGKNYQGRSYYFNGEGAYCQYRHYKYELKEMDYFQAQRLFRNRFDGICVE